MIAAARGRLREIGEDGGQGVERSGGSASRTSSARAGVENDPRQGGDDANGSKTQFQFLGQIRFGHEVEAAHLRAPLLEHTRFGGGFAARAFIAQVDDRSALGRCAGGWRR